MYQPYVDKIYYVDKFKGGALPSEFIESLLRDASRRVDTLTYNRIVAKGFDNLTPFQQEIIKETVCKLAEFYHTNQDQIESYISSYSINGVSMQFGGAPNLEVMMGVYIPTELYSFLQQTGLTCRRFY